MKKEKIFIIAIFNIIVLILIFFICDFFIYFTALQKYPKEYKPSFKYFTSKPFIKFESFKNFFNGTEDWKGRSPDGLEYKNKKPVIIFGCSYAYGYKLKKEQTFSYKLARILKQPVYNRSVSACGLQHMLKQVSSKEFYEEVPQPDKIIYIFIPDIYRRMFINGRLGICEDSFYLHYTEKNGILTEDSYKNPVKIFINSLYFSTWLKDKKIRYILDNQKNADEITDLALLYFLQTRTEIQKNYKSNPKFIIFFWQHPKQFDIYKKILKNKLLANGFYVIEKEDLTDEDLFASKCFIAPNDFHPNESVWNLLTPLIADKIKSL